MDIIDLCDDEPIKRAKVKSSSPNKNAAKSNPENVKSKETPRVPPIRVVNLASLQNIKIINPGQVRQSRRKSVHHMKTNSDANIEFIETKTVVPVSQSSNKSFVSPPKASTSNASQQQQQQQQQQTGVLKVSPKGKIQRPNVELMKRVAFLRVCAEYMLKELGIKNVNLGENQSINMLKAQYLQNKK